MLYTCKSSRVLYIYACEILVFNISICVYCNDYYIGIYIYHIPKSIILKVHSIIYIYHNIMFHVCFVIHVYVHVYICINSAVVFLAKETQKITCSPDTQHHSQPTTRT